MKYLWSPRTISFWSAITGAALIPLSPEWARSAWRVVGIGGVGMAYGSYAVEHDLPIEPIAVGIHLWHNREDPRAKRAIRSIATHGTFWLGAAVVRRRRAE